MESVRINPESQLPEETGRSEHSVSPEGVCVYRPNAVSGAVISILGPQEKASEIPEHLRRQGEVC